MGIWRPFRSRAGSLARLVAALGALAAVFVMAIPADATTANYTNPTACSASVQDGVCISAVSADYGASSVTLGMTVGQATDPNTDPNWLGSDFNTEVLWLIAIDGASTPSYVAEADSNFNDPGTFSGVVFSASTFDTLCDDSTGVDVTFSVSSNQYGVSFPTSCIQSPSSLSVQASWAYATNAATLGEIVTAPGSPDTFTSCCTVTPDSSTTPTSSTTTTTAAPSSTTTTTAKTSTSSTTSTTSVTSTSSTSSTTSTTAITSAGSTSSTTTTAPSSTTTTSSNPALVTTNPSSTGNSGSGSSGLAVTGSGDDLPIVLVAGVLLVTVGAVGRRRVLRVTRRARVGRSQ